ncbi:hypothetical protein MNBD_ALPHA05-1756, partial [hydrothermal vent metagenome]
MTQETKASRKEIEFRRFCAKINGLPLRKDAAAGFGLGKSSAAGALGGSMAAYRRRALLNDRISFSTSVL